MSKRTISPQHRAAFEQLLKELQRFIPIDPAVCPSIVEATKFPKSETTLCQVATPTDFNVRCKPFQPFLALSAPPNHISRDVGLYEFKLRDSVHSSGDKDYFPVSLSLLPSGRRILKVYGLQLDTKTGQSKFDKSTLAGDKINFLGNRELSMIIEKLIENFVLDPTDRRAQLLREQALAELQPN